MTEASAAAEALPLSFFLARRCRWRYAGPAEIACLNAEGETITVLRHWHTPIFHFADGSNSIGEVIARLSVGPSADGEPEGAELEALLQSVMQELLAMGVVELRERADSINEEYDLSVDGEV